MSSQQKIINSRGFYLISNSWKNPRWRPYLMTSQASSSATTHKLYLILLRRSKAFHWRQNRFEILQRVKNAGEESYQPVPPRTTVGVWLCVYVRGFRWKDFILFQVSFKAKNKEIPTDICLKDVDWCDEEHLVCSVSYWIYSDIYNQRLHSRHLCKKPPSTQTQYVPDNEPECSWFLGWSRSGTWSPLIS